MCKLFLTPDKPSQTVLKIPPSQAGEHCRHFVSIDSRQNVIMAEGQINEGPTHAIDGHRYDCIVVDEVQSPPEIQPSRLERILIFIVITATISALLL